MIASKTVPIQLDRERHLLFDYNALAIAEEITGQSLLDGKVWKKPSARVTRALLFAALLHDDPKVRWDEFGRMVEQPELTLNACGMFLQRFGLAHCYTKLVEAWNASNAEAKGESADPQTAQPKA